MPTLLQDAAANQAGWALSPPVPSKMMSIAYLRYEGTTPSIQLLPAAELGQVTTPFAPSAFKGTGAETRLGVMFTIPDSVAEDLRKVEATVRDQLREHISNVDAIWYSSVKAADKYPASVKAKIVVSGDRVCKCFSAEGKEVPLPTDWARLPCIPVLAIRSAYAQRSMAGLVIEVEALLVGEKKAEGPMFL